jgi:hypothetical protein
MTSLYQHQQISHNDMLERESAVERLQSRWISSSRIIVDKPPSSPRRMSRRQSSSPLKDIEHKDLFTNSKWTSGSPGVITDCPPSPPSHRGADVRSLDQSGSRWNSGSQADFGTAATQALGCHRTTAQPSSTSAHKHSDVLKKEHSFETSFCSLNPPRTLRCTTSRSA